MSITVKSDPADPRVDDIVGEVVSNGVLQPDWALHVIDMHRATGNLLDLVKIKAAAFAKR